MRGCWERPALDVVPVVADVTPVEHGVLGDADIDEGGLHAGQDVLDPAPVDVAVDLVGVVGRPGDVVLDQGAALEHGDLGHLGLDVHADQVAADLLASCAPGPSGGGCGCAWPRPRRPSGLGPRRLPSSASAPSSRAAGRRSGRVERHHRAPRPRLAGAGVRWATAGAGLVSPILGFGLGPASRRVGRASARALRWLRRVTLLALADLRLGHEGKPSLRVHVPRVAIGPEPAYRKRLEPCAIALDPLMRSTGPPQHHGGAQCCNQVAGPDAARVRGQFRPETTVGCWSRTVSRWLGGCRLRFDDPSAHAGP